MEAWCEEIYFVAPSAEQNSVGIILSCGIHGDETGPIHVLRRLLTAIQTGSLTPVRPLLLIFGNPQAMRQQRRYVDCNLNRLFGLASLTGVEGQRAEQIITACQRFRNTVASVALHLDLHSTIKPSCIERFALTPVHSSRYSDRWRQVLAQAGFGALVHQTQRANTFSQFTLDQLDADSFTLECGSHQPGRATNNDQLWHWLTGLVVSDNPFPAAVVTGNSESHLEEFTVSDEIIRRSDQFKFLLNEQEPNFTLHPCGTAIYQDRDGTVTIEDERFSLFLNSRVDVGQRAGLLLKRCQQ